MAFDAEKQDYVKVDETLVDHARRLANGVHAPIEAWEEYQRRFPNLKMDQIPMALDEWVSGRIGDARDSMFSRSPAPRRCNEMLRHSNRFVISAYTGAPELLTISKTDATRAADRADVQIVPAAFRDDSAGRGRELAAHDVKGTVGVDKARTPSGSDTYPLDAAAALTADRKSLTLAIVNPSESAQQIDVALKGVAVQDQGRLWRVAAADLTAANEPGKPRVVDIVESPVTQAPGQTGDSSDQHQHLRVPAAVEQAARARQDGIAGRNPGHSGTAWLSGASAPPLAPPPAGPRSRAASTPYRATLLGCSARTHRRIRHDHLAAHSSQDRRAQVYGHRVAVHQVRQQVGGEDHEGDAEAQAEHDQPYIALGGARDGQDVVRGHGEVGHHDVPDGLPEAVRRGRGVGRVAGVHQHLEGDPHDEQAARELHVGDAQDAAPRRR